jgi:ABC-type transport system involved in cytochrome bd biosynthesis fused ATPase/permease subunit
MQSTQQIRLHEYLLDELKTVAGAYQNVFLRQTERLSFTTQLICAISPLIFGDRKDARRYFITHSKRGKSCVNRRSGGGKTTLLLILLRFLKESTGEVLVDDKRIDNEQAWRRLLGYVPQNPYVIDGSIAENIALEFHRILQTEKRYTSYWMISVSRNGESTAQRHRYTNWRRGVKLSGGQRQRLAIARVLYADAEILLLDEITNQVHTFMEKEILSILDNCHQKTNNNYGDSPLSAIPNFFDSIYSLNNGALNELSLQSNS